MILILFVSKMTENGKRLFRIGLKTEKSIVKLRKFYKF